MKKLLEEVQSFYTPMGITKELYVMKCLENYDFIQVINNRKYFYEIGDILMDSHGDDYVNVDSNNIPQIKKFISWLQKLLNNTALDQNTIKDMIDTFAVNVYAENEKLY